MLLYLSNPNIQKPISFLSIFSNDSPVITAQKMERRPFP
jgi:hypothetical protein